ncbi:MAG TPA: DMT family transporter [Firmicutes bacterium]|nr:DMT family transporter [Bacillota bacterium]
MVYAFLAVLAGAMISSQSSCNGVLYPYIGVLGVGFISPFLNAVFSYIFHLVSEKKPLRLNGMPVHASFGGFCSVFVLGLSGYCVARLGTAVSVCLSVSGQLFMSAIVDHFGLFGTEKVSFHSIRIPGFLCILAGIFIINFAGADSFSSIDSRGILFLMLLLALVIGFVTVMARMFTYEATRYVGRFGASCINSLVGSAGALVLILITTGFRPSLSGYVEAPLVSYLTGPLGTVSCYLSNIAYDKIKVFYATICLLVGQIAAGIAADLYMLGSFHPGKIIGIAVVCAGIFWDKKHTAA